MATTGCQYGLPYKLRSAYSPHTQFYFAKIIGEYNFTAVDWVDSSVGA